MPPSPRRAQAAARERLQPVHALLAHEARFRAALAQAFSHTRFTLADLWRKRPGIRAWPFLWEGFSPGRQRPDPDWADRMRRKLGRLQGVEPAPGPRGGEGWRVAPAVVDGIARGREDAAAARAARNTPHRAAAAALSSRYAAVTLDDAAQQVRITYPDLALPPRPDPDGLGRLRPHSVGAVVLEWSRKHRHAGVEALGSSGALTAEWQHAGKLARVLAGLDAEVARHVEGAAKHYEGRLAMLAPYRGAVAPRK